MALTKAQQQSWYNNKLYWLNRYIEQDELNEKDFKVIEKNLKEELKNVKSTLLKELAYQNAKKNNLSNSEVFQFYNTLETIDKTLEEMATKEEKELNTLLENKYKEVYEENMKILGVSFNTINTGLIKETVKTNWSGLEFSDRIWKNKELLVYKIKEEFQKGLIRGDSLQDISNRLIDSLNSSFKNTMRLVRTETCAIQSRATMDSYKDSGVVEKYEFLAFLDNKTSPQCRKMDGKIIELKEGTIGENLPPLHPHCRSCILPVIDDYEETNKVTNNPILEESIEVDPNVNNDKNASKLNNNKKDNKEINKQNNKENNRDRDRDRRRRFISYSSEEELENSKVNKKANKFISTLLEKDRKAYLSVKEYTGSSYDSINRQLRRNEDKGKAELINTISKTIKKFKVPEEFMVHRGTTKSALKGLFKDEHELRELLEKCNNAEITQEYLNNKFIGNILVDKGFMSTSCLTNGAFTKDLSLHINIEKGTNYGAYINELSNYKDKEYEFLLDKNLAMEIYDVEVSRTGRLNLYLNIVGYAD